MDKYDFTDSNIEKSPNEHGVYVLYKNGLIIYIGRAIGIGVTIRSRLRDHKRGYDDPCTRPADQYSYEVTEDAIAREKALLEWYRKNHGGKLPACNELMP